MKISVEYVAQVKVAAGLASETVELEHSDGITDLLRVLVSRHGDAFGSMLLDNSGVLRSSILVTLNDEQVMPHEPVALRDGDRLAIITPMSGG